jgi:hypothetical protein
MTAGELYSKLLEYVTDNPDYALADIRTDDGFPITSIDLVREEHEIFFEVSS